MEKKNTMLLTVIAVATLLVAVVGATFAYFSVSTANSSSTVNVTGQTTAVGAATLTTPTVAMHLNLTAAEMAEAVKGTTYYSAVGEKAYETSAIPQVIAKAEVTGGDETVSYKCDYTLTVKAGATDTMTAALGAGEGKLILAGDSITSSKEIDLSSLATGDATITGSFASLTSAAAQEITAYAQLTNAETEQPDLVNKTLAVEITDATFTCTINE